MVLLVSDTSYARPQEYYCVPSRILKGDMDVDGIGEALTTFFMGRLGPIYVEQVSQINFLLKQRYQKICFMG